MTVPSLRYIFVLFDRRPFPTATEVAIPPKPLVALPDEGLQHVALILPCLRTACATLVAMSAPTT
jgi:hypothetical protein